MYNVENIKLKELLYFVNVLEQCLLDEGVIKKGKTQITTIYV